MDLMPTMLELFGAEVPAEVKGRAHGAVILVENYYPKVFTKLHRSDILKCRSDGALNLNYLFNLPNYRLYEALLIAVPAVWTYFFIN